MVFFGAIFVFFGAILVLFGAVIFVFIDIAIVFFCSCFVCKTDTMHRFQKLTAIVFNSVITVLSHSRHVTQLQRRP